MRQDDSGALAGRTARVFAFFCPLQPPSPSPPLPLNASIRIPLVAHHTDYIVHPMLQVPQFMLEEAAAAGTHVSIVCTQPRRISAMGVAERVASERGEPLGRTVGYSIRLENKSSAATRLLFCTTGILLRRLEEDATLAGTTHVIVDEVCHRGSLRG